ncbi:MAG: hypothetical protein EOM55_02785 [Clostridia bacterium]|nr:hypothetical protein [Clostridia bacterium]
MSEQITTKDLQSLNELMNFENWLATKLKYYSEMAECEKLKANFENMAGTHLGHHKALLDYLKNNKG